MKMEIDDKISVIGVGCLAYIGTLLLLWGHVIQGVLGI